MVRGQPTYSPGVSNGNSVTFGLITVVWRSNSTPPSYIQQLNQTKSIQLTVTNVVAKTVSAVFTFTYENGTSQSSTGTINVKDGSGNFSIYIIAGGLGAGDPLYQSGPAYPIPYIQETVTKLYVGALRSVNAVSLNNTSGSQSTQTLLDWDAQTGFLLEVLQNISYPGQSYSVHFKVTSTNVWPSSTTPDFGFDTVSHSSTPIHLGESATFTVLLNSTSGFASTIYLTPTLLNSTLPKPSLSLSRNSVSLSPNQSNSSTLKFSTQANTPLGLYLFSVNATSGTVSHTATLAVTVSPPDFDISAAPADLTIGVGTVKSSIIIVRSLGIFSGTIALSPTFGHPLNVTLQPATVTLSPTVMSANSTLTVRVPPGSPPGPYYNVGVTGTSGTLSHSIYIPVNVTGPDFKISTSPSQLTIKQGALAQSTVTLTSIMSFQGTVNLFSYSFGGVKTSLDRLSVALNSTIPATATLTVSAPANTPSGNYFAYVNGNGANLTHVAFVAINVTGPDLRMTINPSTFTIQEGMNASSTVTLTSILGFHGTVAITASIYNVNGPTAFLNPANLSLSANATATSKLTIQTSSSIPGYYTIQVTATSGNLTRYSIVSVRVIGPDFGMSASSFSLTLHQGGSAKLRITLSSLNNFNGTIVLSTTVYGPYPGGLSASITPASVTLSSTSTPATANLTIIASQTATPGFYTVQVSGTSGKLTHTVFIQVDVTLAPDFEVTATSPADFNSGATGDSTITITPLNGFTGTVTITTSISPGTGLSPGCPDSIEVTGTAPITGTCQPTSTTPGTYVVEITASGQGVTHNATIVSSVGGFKLSTGNPVDFNSGASGVIPVHVTSLDNFSGNITLTATSSSTGLTVTCPTVAFTLSAATSMSSSCTLHSINAGTYSVTIAASGSPGSFSQSTSTIVHVGEFTISASSGSFNTGASDASITVSLTSTFNFAGSVSLSAIAGPSVGLNVVCPTGAIPLTPNATSTASCTLSSTNPDTYQITVTARGTPGNGSHEATSMVHVGDFAISLTPTNSNFGSDGSMPVSLTSINNFAGPILLSYTESPGGLTLICPLAPSITANATLTVSCSLSPFMAGTYSVTVTGTGSSASSHSASTMVHIGDFTISIGSPIGVDLGSPNLVISVNLTSTLNFAGTIVLTPDVSPATGLTVTCPALTLTANSSASTHCTLNADTTGTFLVTIKGTSLPGTGSHSSSGIVQVVDFTVSAGAISPSTITAGGKGTSSITIEPINGFTGTVTLAVSPPSGLACSFDNTTVQSPGTSNLSCTSNIPGDYTVTVIAFESSTFHRTSLTFHVGSPPAGVSTPPTMLGLQLPQFYSLLGGIIVAITVAGVIVAVRRKRP